MNIKWQRIDLSNDPDIDPYVYWTTIGPGSRHFLIPGEGIGVFPVILELRNGATAVQLRNAFDHSGGPGKQAALLRISVMYLEESPVKRRFFPAVVNLEFFQLLQQDKELSRLARAVAIGPPLANGSFSLRCGEQEPITVTPEGLARPKMTVVGVIDDGIGFGHCRFQRSDRTTRVENAWVQDGRCDPDASTVIYGREFWKTDNGPTKGIDTLIDESSQQGFFDEDMFYRLTGQADFGRRVFKSVALGAAHGTHVMDLAAGEDPANDCADRPIICVQLPASITADTSGAKLDPFVLDAVRYIIDRADQIAIRLHCGPLPIVINFSYGFVAGPHDGTSPLEAELDNIIEQRRKKAPIEVVLPSGNSHLKRLHANVQFDNLGDNQPLFWQVQPDDRTSSFMEIWMPFQHAPPIDSRMSIRLALPATGGASPSLAEQNNTGWVGTLNGDPICMLFYQARPYLNQRGMFFIALLPTAFLDPGTALAPSGVWTVTLINETLTSDQFVQAWIQRDDTPYGYPSRGRQSFFDHACYEAFSPDGFEQEVDDPACIVQRAGSINAISTGAQTIVIGGMRRRELTMAPYSAGGPVTGASGGSADPFRPDAVCVSDDSAGFAGVLAAGTRSGSVVSLQGTSVAAPQIARWVANRLANGLPGGRTAVQGEASVQETGLPANAPPQPPAERGGAGRIRLPAVYPIKRFE